MDFLAREGERERESASTEMRNANVLPGENTRAGEQCPRGCIIIIRACCTVRGSGALGLFV